MHPLFGVAGAVTAEECPATGGPRDRGGVCRCAARELGSAEPAPGGGLQHWEGHPEGGAKHHHPHIAGVVRRKPPILIPKKVAGMVRGFARSSSVCCWRAA